MPRKMPIEADANLRKAREAALLAVETYNRPGASFRTAGFLVLMVVAWTALFHAIFAKRKVKPYYRQKRHPRRFEKVTRLSRTFIATIRERMIQAELWTES